MNKYTCKADDFSVVFKDMLQEVNNDIESKMPKALRSTLRFGKNSVEAHARAVITERHADGYLAGFTTKNEISKGRYIGYIGQKTKPGLVHLLEMGHATMNGGRAREFPHIAPAAAETFAYLEEQIEKAVDEL